MAALKKIKHILTIGSEKYGFRAPDIYGELKDLTGVTKAPTPDNTTYTGKLSKSDFADGVAVKMKARTAQYNSDGSIKAAKEFTVISSFEKAKNALAGLDAKKITVDSATWDIETARIPQRRRFS
jgi:hypothetical protein